MLSIPVLIYFAFQEYSSKKGIEEVLVMLCCGKFFLYK
uniref:Uncharacterized protein n=1 Tax=Rhizophora mucronata TaxID=61149 RepID=A0A2P2MY82_RHIMU